MPFFLRITPFTGDKVAASGSLGTTLFVHKSGTVCVESMCTPRAVFTSRNAAEMAGQACVREGQAFTIHRCSDLTGEVVADQVWR